MKPTRIWSMVNEKEVAFTYENGRLIFELEKLGDFEGIVMEK
ncbi:hypothetical protein [Cyclobacterium plantarum]